MRICLIGNVGAVHLRRWARAYAERGHEVHVVGIRDADLADVTVHPIRFGSSNTPSAPAAFASYARLAATARPVIGRIGPDVVHAHYVTTSGLAARLSGAHPVVLTAWGSDVLPPNHVRHNPVIRAVNDFALAGADRVTSASVFMQSEIARRYGIDDVRLVPFGVDTDRFHPAPRRSAPLRVGVAKSLNSKYGIHDAIRAFGVMAADIPDAELVLAGDGPLRTDLEALTASLGIEARVTFLGRVDHDDMPDFMRSIDVLINPSVVPESFGVAVLEAQASGVPVVATDVGGVPEACVAGETALLVPAHDVGAMAAALERFTDDRRRAAFGSAGRAFVQSRFEWSRTVDMMVDVLDEVLS